MCALNAKQTTTESGFDKLNHWKKFLLGFGVHCSMRGNARPQTPSFQNIRTRGASEYAHFSTRGSREEAEKKKKTKTAQSNSVVK